MTPFLVLLLPALAWAKIYGRCELARELKYVHGAPGSHVATWVCIAEHESSYNSNIVGYMSGDSGDHGLFQISDKFWCSPPGTGKGCGMSCAQFEDDDISDDFECAKIIYNDRKEKGEDGFNPWAVYNPHCKADKAQRYVKDCFSPEELKAFAEEELSTYAPPVSPHRFYGTSAGRPNQGSTASFPPSTAVGFPTRRPTTSRFPTFGLPTSRPASIFPIGSRPSIFSSSPSTTRTPFSTLPSLLSPTSIATRVQNSPITRLVSNPVFIFNRVRWF